MGKSHVTKCLSISAADILLFLRNHCTVHFREKLHRNSFFLQNHIESKQHFCQHTKYQRFILTHFRTSFRNAWEIRLEWIMYGGWFTPSVYICVFASKCENTKGTWTFQFTRKKHALEKTHARYTLHVYERTLYARYTKRCNPVNSSPGQLENILTFQQL
jgi:hypothetical protein